MALIAKDLVPRIRILIYNPSQETISDETIEQIIQTWIEILGDDDKQKCAVLWNSLMSVLEYLWNTDIIKHGTEVGNQSSRKEKVGGVEVSVTYSQDGMYTSPWEDIYKSYLNGNLIIPGCNGVGGASSKILVGGVDAVEIARVNSSINSVNGLGGVASVDRITRNVNFDLQRYPRFYRKR